jgi:hypothetical protein
VYRHVPRDQIADALSHLRELFRGIKPSNEQEYRAHEKREVVTKNLLSNLFRTKEHPTLNSVLEIGDIFSLTLDGAHRLFGYSLQEIREFDRKLNGGRTHIEGPHQRLRSGEVHRPLCVGHTCKRKCGKHRPQRACRLEKLSFGEGLRPSLDAIGGVAT